jgi:hypothetical protein
MQDHAALLILISLTSPLGLENGTELREHFTNTTNGASR